MTSPRHLRAAPIVPTALQRRLEPSATLEGAGILPGSSLLATPEEVERQEQEQRERVDAGIAVLDAALAAVWSCKACGAHGRALGGSLCDPCRAVAVQLNAEAHMGDLIGQVSRRELVAHYLSEQA
jgi:hypothetical protein